MGQNEAAAPHDSRWDVGQPEAGFRETSTRESGADLPDPGGDLALVDATDPGDCPSGVLLADGTCEITDPAGDVTCPDGRPCRIICPSYFSCPGLITCGDGPCTIECGVYSCSGGIRCGQLASCTVHCFEDSTCGNITCGPQACSIDCAAQNACSGELDCSTSCRCELHFEPETGSAESCPQSCYVKDYCSPFLLDCDSC